MLHFKTKLANMKRGHRCVQLSQDYCFLPVIISSSEIYFGLCQFSIVKKRTTCIELVMSGPLVRVRLLELK